MPRNSPWGVVAAATLTVLAVSCGSPGAPAPSSAAAPSFREVSGRPRASTIDADGSAWVVDDRGTSLVLINADGPASAELSLVGIQSDEPYGMQVTPFGDGIVLGRILCTDAGCEGPRLRIERFRRDGDRIVPTTTAWDSGVIDEPGAVRFAGRRAGTIALRSEGVVAVITAARTEELRTEPGGGIGAPCLTADGWVAARFDGSNGDNATAPQPTAAAHGARQTGSLVGRVGDRWQAIARSEFAFPADEGLDLRCAAGSMQIAPDLQPARQEWQGHRWAARGGREIMWTTPVREDQFGLVGGVNGSVVRIDPATGRRTSDVQAPGAIGEEGGGGSSPPDALDVALGPSGVNRALVCANAEEATCALHP